MELLCPICGELLTKQDRSYRCEKNHSFDIARQGHVNLLPVQNKRSLNAQLEYLAQECVREFEQQHGEIPVAEEQLYRK